MKSSLDTNQLFTVFPFLDMATLTNQKCDTGTTKHTSSKNFENTINNNRLSAKIVASNLERISVDDFRIAEPLTMVSNYSKRCQLVRPYAQS